MQIWDDMVRTALVGTERNAPTLPVADGAIEASVARLNAGDKEGTVLAAAGILALVRRAGQTVETVPAEALPRPAEGDDLPRVSEAAAHDLGMMLAGEHNEALGEWLDLVGERGLRVPEEFLPKLLDMARLDSDMRVPLGRALGKRGRWLAAQNKEWDFALQRSLLEGESEETEAEIKRLWEEETRGERTSALATVRRRDPRRGREMLEAVWASEPYEERTAFIKVLEDGLSPDDEPFLEAALDDKRKEVRTVAQQLLQTLPDSAFLRRMADRLRPLVFLNKKGHIELNLPDAFDKAWARDGIEQKVPQYNKIGEKTFWTQQMVALAPLSFWETHLSKTPTELLAANADKEWSDLLLQHWRTAFVRQKTLSWAEPLLRHQLHSHERVMRGNVTIPWGAVLPPAALEKIALEFMGTGQHFNYTHPIYPLLMDFGPRWSVELATALLSRIKAALRPEQKVYDLTYTIQNLAPFIPDEAQDEFLAIWEVVAGTDGYYRQQWEKQMSLRRFRQEMVGKITARS